jgi:NADPH:quinone reductase
MRAFGFTNAMAGNDPASFAEVELPDPVASGHDVLVRVQAVSVNPVDTKVRANSARADGSLRVIGFDAAGIVEAVGDAVTLFAPGDRVYYAGDLTRPGTNSALHLVDERLVGPMPTTLDFPPAAALPLTAITAWEALFDRMGLAPDGSDSGKTILIIGGAGGVGSIAIQLAHSVAKLNVIATASQAESSAWVKKMGAGHVINHHGDMPAQLRAIGVDHIDAILCLNATDHHWPAMTEIIAPQGVICSIVETNQPVDLNPLKSKSARFAWEFMFTRSMFQTDDMIRQHQLLTRVSQFVDDGILQSTMTQNLGHLTADSLRAAHNSVANGRTIGKLVLEWQSNSCSS